MNLGCSASIPDIDPVTAKLLKESGASEELHKSPLTRDESLVVGHAPLQYDPYYNPSDDKFRMAIMIVGKDGKTNRDFFAGLPNLATKENATLVGRGNARVAIPMIWSPHTKTNKDAKTFGEFLPELVERELELTFKEFSGSSYYLRNLPVGRAFIWIQTKFDGNRVVQYPIVVDVAPEKGKISRIDLDSGDWKRRFHML
ncbi:MAG: hypothetical protein IT366_01575 [Candidatus Hydrogenedentes bacterium]|nr:hypothetical protein [Candidatus Hydrogenedentota bacterium]